MRLVFCDSEMIHTERKVDGIDIVESRREEWQVEREKRQRQRRDRFPQVCVIRPRANEARR